MFFGQNHHKYNHLLNTNPIVNRAQIQLFIAHKSNCHLYTHPVNDRMFQTVVSIFLISLMAGLVVGDTHLQTHLQLDDDYDKNLLPPRFLFQNPKFFCSLLNCLILAYMNSLYPALVAPPLTSVVWWTWETSWRWRSRCSRSPWRWPSGSDSH